MCVFLCVVRERERVCVFMHVYVCFCLYVCVGSDQLCDCVSVCLCVVRYDAATKLNSSLLDRYNIKIGSEWASEM